MSKLERATAAYDPAFEAELGDVIIRAIADASMIDGVLVIRTGETAAALVATMLALSPSATRNRAAIKTVADGFRRKLTCGRLCGRDAAKHPYGRLAKDGVHSATLDSGIVKHWFGYVVPDANLGVACDRLVVLDIDPRHDGHRSLAALEHECALPETWRTLTGGGGEHILFAAPDGVSVKNYSNMPGSVPPLGPGIDIRARGGYIVAPPSRHINGRRYEFSVDHHPQDTPLAPLPEWLAERLVAQHAAHGDSDGNVAPIPGDEWARLTSQPISEYRDQAVLRITGHLFRHNCDYDLVRGMLHAWNSAWCKPPLGFHELDKLINRVADLEAARIEREIAR